MEEHIPIAAIGEENTIILFNAIGIKTYLLTNPTEVAKTILTLEMQQCKIIYLSEDLYLSLPEIIEKYQSIAFPIIIPIPIKKTSMEIGKKKIRANVEKAIGIDIL
ncbi:MAG: V-type ATP synthase subunit F [Bacilli bacterium]|nr:V-type ATP synthase subunit F [Bacilli bacterium]